VTGSAQPLSVLVIDEQPEVLGFFSRLLDGNGMRALLARNGLEAIGIAERSFMPIDLVLANILLTHDPAAPENGSAPELVEHLRRLRPRLPALYMSASLDAGVIRIELLESHLHHMSRTTGDRTLIDTIRDAASGRPTGRLLHRTAR
jgi:CheY-like chemotaxis protein